MTNDAAERLRQVFRTSEVFGVPWEGGVVLLDAALAAERRATVERTYQDIQEQIGRLPVHTITAEGAGWERESFVRLSDVRNAILDAMPVAILDALAARGGGWVSGWYCTQCVRFIAIDATGPVHTHDTFTVTPILTPRPILYDGEEERLAAALPEHHYCMEQEPLPEAHHSCREYARAIIERLREGR